MSNSKFTSLEIYLAQIAHELRALPAQARADEMREIESHLRALIEAGQQLEEISESEALATALRQFGEPRQIGRKLRLAWERKQPEAWWRASLAILSIFAVVLIHFLVTRQFIIAEAESNPAVTVFEPHLYLNLSADSLMFRYFPLVLMTASIFSTFAKGYIAALISPKRGVLIALSLISLQLILSMALTPNYFASYLPALSSFTGLIQDTLIVLLGAHLGARYSRMRGARITKSN